MGLSAGVTNYGQFKAPGVHIVKLPDELIANCIMPFISILVLQFTVSLPNADQ